jgi:hypothetical protein
VADVSLNGAQITGLITILSQVPAGLLSKDGAAALISASFPSISPASVAAILSGVTTTPLPAEPPKANATPAPPAARAVAARAILENRAMTISIDFDKTFAADPKLWGEFALQSAADGNTVVMISRREDTPENQKEIADTVGDYVMAFSQIMLIGGDTLKADAAAAAGIKVDVWVDDAPLTIADCCSP